MTLKKGITIDVGHEGVAPGFDPGAVNASAGIKEADYNLKISLYQFDRFKELGVPVAITRTGDKKLDNNQRTNLIKQIGYQDCISNHNNAGGGDGAEFIHSIHSDGKFEEICKQEMVKAGQNVRRIFSRALPSNAKQDYYFMHRNTGNVKTTIVEYAFIDSKGDDIIQLKNSYKQLAEAVVKAYCSYRGYKYTPPGQKAPVAPPVAPHPTPTNKFTDVPTNHAFYKEIEHVVKEGIFNGTTATTFDPKGTVTREQLATVVSRLLNKLKG